ncbi:Plasmodium exported protein, unknown function [Plasmodium gonderi]|uniref:Pv-fam-h protein n=1 Tax=Plasmodium gonderi TaxID=77519 RepID=A0A1Y1JJ12_PLAGO|nr:Plasmodium exported protein, unknown function [Plasmodium gonderi]GAW80443.1 Plasmodium exported protein, unknown function [Plasmodium gonderi]
MFLNKSKKGDSICANRAKYVASPFNNNDAKTKNDNCTSKIMSTIGVCKIVGFSLLLWIIECSNVHSSGETKRYYSNEKASGLIHNRLLGQPIVEFDEVFDMYQSSFLDKMGCDDAQKGQIKTMMKSYFDKIDLSALAQQFQQSPCGISQCPPIRPGAFPPMNPGMFPLPNACMIKPPCPNFNQGIESHVNKEGKKEGSTNSAHDGQVTEEEQNGKKEHKTNIISPCTNSMSGPVFQYLNFFNFLWSFSFIIASSLISAVFGQYKISFSLFSILFLKVFNFIWGLKNMHDMFFPSKK